MQENSEKFQWQNYQLKAGLKEGEDYMIVSSELHDYWVSLYESENRIKRFGIKDESGENLVEIYLKKINLLPIPNKKYFSLYREPDCQTTPVFCSRVSSMAELQKKIIRLLNYQLY